MRSESKKHQLLNHPISRLQRESIEKELSRLAKLMSAEGFIDYYLRMTHLYPSNRLAYERLEEFYETLTGKRRYSDFKSFLIILDRYLKSVRKAEK